MWDRVDKSGPNGCWLWTGPKSAGRAPGYGRVYIGGKGYQAHRLAYEELVGPIPAGLVIDHLCRNPACVNPAHLEPVTNAENIRRGLAIRTHCPQGHEYTPENVRHRANGHRSCKRCHRDEEAVRKRRKPGFLEPPSICEDGMRHYEVISGEMVTCSWMEPPEPFCCWGLYLAKNKHSARAMAVKDPEFHEWVREKRGDGVPPFTGLKVQLTRCDHGHCWGCDPCPTCEAEDKSAWLLDVATS